MSLSGRAWRAVRISHRSLRVTLVAAFLLVAWIAQPDRSALAQADPCSLITTEEVEAVIGTGVQATPSDLWCTWSGTTSDGDFTDVQLMPDVIDAQQYMSGYPNEPIEVAGYPAYESAQSGLSMIAVQLPTSAPWISVITVADLDASAAAISLLEIAIERIAPDGGPTPASPEAPTPPGTANPTLTPAPATPAPTPSAPGPTAAAEPTPFVDPGECLRAIEAADLADVASIDAIAACRFTHAGLEAARTALTSGGTRDQLWAAVWLYATWATDPAPLLPVLAADDPSIRAMAAAALLRLGEPAAIDVLTAAVTDQGILLGSLPPNTISAYVQSILARLVATDGTLASPGPEADPVDTAEAWRAWLEDHTDQLVYDAATGGWSVP